MHKYRTHICSELRKSHVGQTVKLSGWVHSKRDHGSLIFIDLRDHFGITQLVTDSLQPIKLESVITVMGEVVARATDAVNTNIKTGEIEVKISQLIVESAAEQIPFQINDSNEIPMGLA
jgi:aspartyl-tRNA synthetase